MTILTQIAELMAWAMSSGYQVNTLVLSSGMYDSLKKECGQYIYDNEGNRQVNNMYEEPHLLTFLGLNIEIDYTGNTVIGLKYIAPYTGIFVVSS